MQIPPSLVKILKREFIEILNRQDWLEILLKGQVYKFEEHLHQELLELYNKICEMLIEYLSLQPAFVSAQKEKAEEEGLKKLEFRKASLRIRTGKKIRYDSLYAKKAPAGYEKNRHLSLQLWQSEDGNSPMYKSITCLYSVLCPSFEVSKWLLQYQGIESHYEIVRSSSLNLATACMAQRSSIQLEKGETLSGKRVIIAMDGARTRTREYEEEQAGRTKKFRTPWREPKMFVITTCDEDGQINRSTKPIYDGTFGDDKTFELLAQYLKGLEIDKAQSVQFLADGAPWIWNRVKPMLLRLGVASDKIIEALDYYHAIEHVNDMKVYFDQDKQTTHFEKLKDALWKGDFMEMKNTIQEGIKNVDLEEFNPFKYFEKQKERIDYQFLRNENRPCGSGIIESAIRRIINLRFKSSSTFWYPENVEKLIFMRGVALSGRWKIMMKNKFN